MKRKTILPALILSVILITAFLVNYSILDGKLKESDQQISQLSSELEDLKEQISTQNQEISDQLQTLSDAILLVQTEGKERSSDVDEYLKSLHDGLDQANRNLSKKYTALSQASQIPVPTPIIIEEKPSQSPVPLPSIDHKESLLLHDVRVSQFYNAGLEAYKNEKYSQAKSNFAELLDFDPPIWEAHLYYIKAAYEENPGRAATDKTVKMLLDTLPLEMDETGQVSKYKGLLALETGDYDHGISLIEESLQKNPEAKKLHLLLGECYLYLKKPEKANLVFQEIISLFPASPESGEAKIYLERSRVTG